ncbi:MAG: cytochrome c [bacterium]|jgi:cytochrome c2/uncharacterized membrane protein|nr:cytochrome c [bacterium]
MPWLERLLPGMSHTPDLHPMLVHFPIVLMPAALVLAVLAWWRRPNLWPAARVVFLIGVVSLVVTGATGLMAQARIAHGPNSAVSVHRQFMLAAGGLALLLVGPVLAIRSPADRRRGAWFPVALVALNAVLVLGADRGALVSLQFRGGPIPVDAVLKRDRPVVPAAALLPGDAEAGARLYAKLACDACHGPDRREEAPGIPPGLETAGSRLRAEWMRAYLKSPRPVRWADQDLRPEVRMPDFRLTDGEADDLVAFLSQRRDSTLYDIRGPEAPPYTEQEIECGRALIGEYNCRGCHVLGGNGAHLGPDLDSVGERLNPEYIAALLRAPQRVVPGTSMRDFGLWDDEIRCLTAYTTALRSPTAPQ